MIGTVAADSLADSDAPPEQTPGGTVASGAIEPPPALPVPADVQPYHRVLPDGTSLTPALDGSQGLNRAPRSVIGTQADDDFTAAAQFVQMHLGSQNTFLAYRAEIARLLRWAVLKKKKPVSSLSMGDIWDYACFLMDPPADWCQEKRRTRKGAWSAWQPFVGAPRDRTVKRALGAVSSFFDWGVKVQYFRANPVAMYKSVNELTTGARNYVAMQKNGGTLPTDAQSRRQRAALTGPVNAKGRHLDPRAVWAVKQALKAMPTHTEVQRLEAERALFMVTLLYCTGTRGGVACTGIMGDIQDAGGGLWVWTVIDKGAKSRDIPFTDELMKALERYRRAFGFSPLPVAGDDTPLLLKTSFLSARRKAARLARKAKRAGKVLPPVKIEYKPITHRRLNQVLDEIGEQAAAIIQLTDGIANKDELCAQLLGMSAHWWRHTAGTDLGNEGAGNDDIAAVLGHADPSTTKIYVHRRLKRLKAMMNDMLIFGYDEDPVSPG
jgi:integrase/recombinase XerD